MTRPMPEHGTRARYLRGCRCSLCGAANRRYCKQYRNQAHQTGHATRIPSGPVTERIRYWLSQDYTYGQIAAATRSSHHTIISHARGENPTVHPRIAARILSTCLGPESIPDSVPVDPTGTVRRLQAMAAIGHTFRAIGAEIGIHPDAVSRIANGRHATVLGSTAHRVAELYRRWSLVPGRSVWCRNQAASKGWHGPAAWDDIDDPKTLPDTSEGVVLNLQQAGAERLAEMRLLASAGVQPEQIAQRLGVTTEYVRHRMRTQLPHLYLELTA